MDKSKAFIIDLETYPNVFLCAVIRADGKFKQVLEVSHRKNELYRVIKLMNHMKDTDSFMVSFNGIGFDYPVMHEIYTKFNSFPKSGKNAALKLFKIAQKQIDSFKGEGFGNTIRSEDCIHKQLDLYRIWHFNNKAKATSLKLLEFNMRMDNIQDLPFAVGQELSDTEIDILIKYNEHDIKATLNFFELSQEHIDFRIKLSEQYNKDWYNVDDTKIGSEYFAMKLEEANIKLREFKNGKQVLRQTKRDKINLSDCLFSYYDFHLPEFIAVKDWFSKQIITETKGVFSNIEEHLLLDVAKYSELTTKKKKFKNKPSDEDFSLFKKEHPLGWLEEEELKSTEYELDQNGNYVMEYPLDEDGCPDLTKKMKKKRIPKKSYWGCWKVAETLNVVVNGFRFDFGVGGIHGSLSSKVAKETKRYQLIDADVSSMYPNIAISNRIYPEHLSEIFCDIYKDMYEQRKSFAKGTAENAMLKLALNGTYGKSNDKYSVFLDPKFTMQITINGQLSLCLLAEKLFAIKDLKVIQVNTDGITVALPRESKEDYDIICTNWQKQVGLKLEFADYSKMFIRDVNNYIALYTNGKVKRKGAYEYEKLDWHKNHSALVIAKAAEAYMVKGIPVEEFIKSHTDIFDFMLRTKVPRTSKLVLVMDDGTEVIQQNICRYYPCEEGGKLVKIMPPLEEGGQERRLRIDTEWKVKTCNNMQDFNNDINYEYYISEVSKLIINPS